MKKVLSFFGVLKWFNWGSIIPGGMIFPKLVEAFGGNKEAMPFSIIAVALTVFQVFCLGWLAYVVIHDYRKNKKEIARLHEEIAQRQAELDMRRELNSFLEMGRSRREELDRAIMSSTDKPPDPAKERN